MKNLVSAIHCSITKEGQLLVDPSAKEEQVITSLWDLLFKDSESSLTFAYSPLGLVSSKTKGSFSETNYYACAAFAKKGCTQILTFLKASLENKNVR